MRSSSSCVRVGGLGKSIVIGSFLFPQTSRPRKATSSLSLVFSPSSSGKGRSNYADRRTSAFPESVMEEKDLASVPASLRTAEMPKCPISLSSWENAANNSSPTKVEVLSVHRKSLPWCLSYES